jgi:hypothetical protein
MVRKTAVVERVTEGGDLRMRYLAAIGALAVLAATHPAPQLRPQQVERGGQWLSWSPGERNAYIGGLITGYSQGTLRACSAADRLFEVDRPHDLGDEQHPSEVPSARCLATVAHFSKCKWTGSDIDCSAYATPITEFYTRHPEYQGIAFPFIMIDFLSDGRYSTADQLYEQARKGKLHVIR